MTTLSTMLFSEFLEMAQATGGMNRFPKMGGSKEAVSYSVYLNGDLENDVPASVREQEFRDVTIHALTEQLGLNPQSFRDNLKVAELVAVRHAYMTSVLEASMLNTLSETIQNEFALLSDSLSHPFIQAQIAAQRELSGQLRPVLDEATKALGGPAEERSAGGVSRGAIISQNDAFSVQDVGGGNIVAHENRRLENVPAIGQDVTVAYYRGKGQVIENLDRLAISPVYVDEKSGDLAVRLIDPVTDEIKQVVMFTKMAMVAEFAEENNLGKDFVRAAMDAREATPKELEARAVRKLIEEPFIDALTDSIAVKFQEGSLIYTAVFRSADEFEGQRRLYGATEVDVALAYQAESLAFPAQNLVEKSMRDAMEMASQRGADIQKTNVDSGRYNGSVIATTAFHVVQDVGRNSVQIHDKRNLDKVPFAGEKVALAYKAGRAQVDIREPSKERTTGRV